MFKPLLTSVLAHLIAQNQWAKPLLMPFPGQSVQFQSGLAKATLVILEDGGLAMAGETNPPDAILTIPPGVALRIMARDETASQMVQIEGNIALANAIAQVLQHIKWDIEEDLSRIVGDAPASELVKFGKKISSTSRQQITNVAAMFTEYWQEEKPLIAKKRHIEQFIGEVDKLREDAERLEKRLARLEARTVKTSSQ